MRKNILLLSAALLFAACADDQQTTAPNGPRSGAASRSTAPDLPPGPSARPADQVGWTKAVTVSSTPLSIAPGAAGFATATCPAGTILVGGGYSLDLGFGVAPIVYLNNPGIGGTGWNAGAKNLNAAGGSYIAVHAVARCAS